MFAGHAGATPDGGGGSETVQGEVQGGAAAELEDFAQLELPQHGQGQQIVRHAAIGEGKRRRRAARGTHTAVLCVWQGALHHDSWGKTSLNRSFHNVGTR